MTAFARLLSLLLLGSALSVAVAASPYFVDGDGDEVSDEIDDCPYTHPGVRVDAKGCPLSREDADLDGVPDEDDNCPYSTPGAQVDAQGCALDSDFDGVPNGLDRCPQTPLALVVDAKGCAVGEQMSAAPAVTPKKPAPILAPKALPPPVPMPQPKLEMPAKPLAAALAPIIAAPPPPVLAVPAPVPVIQPPVVTPVQTAVSSAPLSMAESPEMVLRFGYNSGRLGKGDLAVIESYASLFKRRLLLKPAAKLRIEAYADRRETDPERLAAARVAIVRVALIGQGIPEGRLEQYSSLMEAADAGNARRVEARIND